MRDMRPPLDILPRDRAAVPMEIPMEISHWYGKVDSVGIYTGSPWAWDGFGH